MASHLLKYYFIAFTKHPPFKKHFLNILAIFDGTPKLL